jgi:hypothetical protein
MHVNIYCRGVVGAMALGESSGDCGEMNFDVGTRGSSIIIIDHSIAASPFWT